MQLINPTVSPNQLKTTLMPHRIFHGDACFAYFNKIWGIPVELNRLIVVRNGTIEVPSGRVGIAAIVERLRQTMCVASP